MTLRQKILFVKKMLLLCITAIALIGCASNRYNSYYNDNLAVPYKKYDKSGIASNYGNGDHFDGRRMANGRVFHKSNPHIAASPNLPLGTKLKVTNLRNGKSVYVEVTDRMGHVKHRIIDLSYAAAHKIGALGLTHVHIHAIPNSVFYAHMSKAKKHKQHTAKHTKHVKRIKHKVRHHKMHHTD